jgi:PBP1b-binding outer membrane lipoprotein LpoB
MKKLALVLAIALLVSSCATHCYPVTGVAKRGCKMQQDKVQSQFP